MSLRVCAYCRVSTDKGDQINSMKNQKDFFEGYINNREDWQLTQIFADEGITGTSTQKRAAFNQMIDECQKGNIDLILTKEVSRFARNTVDTLKYTRLLKQYQVGIIFINDNIDTRQNDGEFRLSIMASVAQEESRKTSERVKWGQRRSMERGVVFGNDSMFGFITKNGELTIKEEEAEIIRLIYSKFVNEGKGTHVIARELYEEGIAPPKASTKKWSSAMILRILKNEKYVGDLLQKKNVTLDYLTHKRVQNKGYEEKIFIRDHHPPIIDRRLWEQAQKELDRRKPDRELKNKYSNRYWCSGKIICGCCGSKFVIRRSKRADGSEYIAWGCCNRVRYGNWKQDNMGEPAGCSMHMVNGRTLETCAAFILQKLNLDYDLIIEELITQLENLKLTAGTETQNHLEAKIRQIQMKKEHMMDAYFGQTISEEEMLAMKERYDTQLQKINTRIFNLCKTSKTDSKQCKTQANLADIIRESVIYSDSVFRETIEKITVHDDCIVMKARFLPYAFRLCYTTHGYKEKYMTVIESCEIIQPQ